MLDKDWFKAIDLRTNKSIEAYCKNGRYYFWSWRAGRVLPIAKKDIKKT